MYKQTTLRDALAGTAQSKARTPSIVAKHLARTSHILASTPSQREWKGIRQALSKRKVAWIQYNLGLDKSGQPSKISGRTRQQLRK